MYLPGRGSQRRQRGRRRWVSVTRTAPAAGLSTWPLAGLTGTRPGSQGNSIEWLNNINSRGSLFFQSHYTNEGNIYL